MDRSLTSNLRAFVMQETESGKYMFVIADSEQQMNKEIKNFQNIGLEVKQIANNTTVREILFQGINRRKSYVVATNIDSMKRKFVHLSNILTIKTNACKI